MRMPGTQADKEYIQLGLVDRLRSKIMNGVLRPGDRVSESKWVSIFKASDASFREAIKVLEQEGFVTKQRGRGAQVSKLGETDVLNLHQLRRSVEGLAAQLAATRRADLSRLQQAVEAMREALAAGNRDALLQWDCRFHLRLCDASGNLPLAEHSCRIISPFFAFVRMQAAARSQEASFWAKDLDVHQKIVDLIEAGDGNVAEQTLHLEMSRFLSTAFDNWLGCGVHRQRSAGVRNHFLGDMRQ